DTPGIEVTAAVLAQQAQTPEAVVEVPATPAPTAPSAEPEAATAATTPPAPAAPQTEAAKAVAPSFIPAPPAKPTLWQQLQENPLIPAGTAALALLLGLLGYRAWKKRKDAAAAQDPALGDSQLKSDSFFGGRGGQQVDTNSAEGATTMAYSPSQLDGGGDVDPVAEADVYLAYGRDVQAEEILKEALRNYPQRLPVHMKLAEIYAKRHDVKALENTARTMQGLCTNDSADWQRVMAMGRSLDPSNPLYAPADPAEPSYKPTTSFADALQNAQPLAGLAGPATAAAVGAGTGAALAHGLPDLDLNLDLDLPGGLADNQPLAAAPSVPPVVTSLPSDEEFAALEPQHSLDTQLDLSVPSPTENPPTLVTDTVMPDDTPMDISSADGLDFDLSNFNMPESAAPVPAPAPVVPSAAQDDVFDLGTDLNFDSEPAAPVQESPIASTSGDVPAASTPEPMPMPDQPEMGLDFDIGALDMDPASETDAAAAAQSGQNDAQDALTTKLDLAQEFNAIGDSEGARALIEEVLAEASGAQKARAQKMLSEID
ncbi:MAG: hypothetical protein KBT18_02170, partial [Comamonas sp.]|nr:hypothetical protein [Candidatus Comamonas equi]